MGWRRCRSSPGSRRARFTPFGAVAVALLAAAAAPTANAFGEAPKFLIASSPGTSTLAYVRLPEGQVQTSDGAGMRVLLNSGLQFPQGIAVDDFRRMLYVADPGLGKLVRFPLDSSGSELKVGKMETVASSVEVRAVAVDGIGNVWFTDEPNQRIMRVTAKMIEEGRTVAEVVYDGADLEEVRAPGGIAVDNFHVYWLNKAGGRKVGSLIRGSQHPPTAVVAGNVSTDPDRAKRSLHALASNADKCYGVCLAQGHAFFSDEATNLYGIPRSSVAQGGEAVSVSMTLTEPRGCAYDGESTVFVADKAQNTIWSFAANMETLLPGRELVKAAELQGAFGVAVFTDLEGDIVE